MDLTFLNQTGYLLDVWTKKVSDNPSARMLTDERKHMFSCVSWISSWPKK